ncbi:putative methyltransferase [Ameyamaea chiangmaiensis NBRC 103196]|nr:putative methyltransferase [Ameyamaea chiangmaiensis NBRC 103196]
MLSLLAVGMAVPTIAHANVVPTLGRGKPAIGISRAIADNDRPEQDRSADAARKPAALLTFAGIRPGMAVADVMPGRGYFTRLFSNVVGPKGHVYAIVPAWLAQKKPTAADAVNAIAQEAAFANVSVSVEPLETLSVPRPLDVVWTSQNYHDIYYGQSADAALAFDKAAFAALRPGGSLVIVDHVALPGGVTADIAKLHRIDPAIIRQQAEAAGFVFQTDSTVLANPSDPHTVPVFDPSIRGKTDQVVLKFVKPAR